MTTLPNHLFASECDGALYDTRADNWSKAPALRAIYCKHFSRIETVAEFKATLRAGAYAWPGGYPLCFITADGAALSFNTVKANARWIIDAIAADDSRSGWRIAACAINWEDGALYCDHSGERIESACGDDDASEDDDAAESANA